MKDLLFLWRRHLARRRLERADLATRLVATGWLESNRTAGRRP